MSNKRKAYLFIDGTNLYAGQYELFGPNKYLSFPRFLKAIETKLKLRFARIYFYASYSPQPVKLTKKAKKYLKNEALFYRSVKKTPRTVFFKGYRSPTSGKEKEVDVKLAVDIVDFAYRNKYDDLYLLSGDADFMAAIQVAQKLAKRIVILAIQNRVPNRFSYNFPTVVFFLTEKLNDKFFPRQKIKLVRLRRGEIWRKVR